MNRTLLWLAFSVVLTPLAACRHHAPSDPMHPDDYDVLPGAGDGGVWADGAPIEGDLFGSTYDGTDGNDAVASRTSGGGAGSGSGSGEGGTVLGAVIAGGTSSASSEDPCATLTPTWTGTEGADTYRGGPGRDVIFALGGDDVIWGNGGDDVICAGGGEDVIEGGDGDDYIDGGFGKDQLHGGAGADVIHGRSGGDTIHGDAGNDHVYGDLLDDTLYGDDGNDVIVGGHGTDYMHGGTGDDWLRGDTNNDELIGGDQGPHGDTVSFMTATPPGQPLGMLPAMSGIILNANDPMMGWSSGDGRPENVVGFENVIGSPFDDMVLTSPAVRAVWPSYGADSCNGAACAHASGVRPDGVLVFATAATRDTGLVVLGSTGDDTLRIAVTSTTATVTSEGAAPVTAGAGCTLTDPHVVTCRLVAVLAFITAYGDAGNDEITLRGDMPRDVDATIDGGDGDDILDGHQGQDILFAGHSGHDQLRGLGGDDALISESRDSDVMDAGAGNDQLVANWPCATHIYIGGPGEDVAGFARVGNFDTAAERAEQSIHAQIGARGFQPHFCAETDGTFIHGDAEILEGAGGDDVLTGFDGDHDETIWGREGDDTLRGLGGNDVLEGLSGNDEIYGGPGRDRLRGGDGNDRLHAQDGEVDAELNVGGSGCVADRDPSDPMAVRTCG